MAVFYRVQMKRKHIDVDQFFEHPEEACTFLNAQRVELGLAPVEVKKELSQEGYREIISDFLENPPFEMYVKKYISTYVAPKYERYKVDLLKDRNLAEAKAKLRNLGNTESFFRIINNTEVDIGHFGSLGVALQYESFGNSNGERKLFKDLKISEITSSVINNYARARIAKGIRAQSIQREITFISNIFTKLHKMNPSFDGPVPNPTRDYDREILEAAQPPKRKFFRFSDERKEAFLAEVDKHENKDFSRIVRLMLLTAMRRSEVVLLQWNQVHQDYIELYDTKTNPRPVYLTKDSKELLASIPRIQGESRVFPSYSSVLGFDGSYTKFIKEKHFFDADGQRVDFSDITTHKLRKEAISGFVEKIGADNSLLIAEILGISSIRKLEENIREMPKNSMATQRDVLQSVGHKNSEVTKRHYFSIKKK